MYHNPTLVQALVRDRVAELRRSAAMSPRAEGSLVRTVDGKRRPRGMSQLMSRIER